MNKLEKLLATVRNNLLEYYALSLLTVGVPLIAYLYFGWKAALSTFIIVQVTLSVLAFARGNK